MKPKIVARHHFCCHQCRVEFSSFDHLIDQIPRRFGPWDCSNRDCRVVARGTVFPDGGINVEWSENTEKRGLALLYFRGLYCIYDQLLYQPDHDDYFFHSHQCPTNIMSSILKVYDPEHGDDPHGVFRHVASIPATIDNQRLLGLADLPKDGTEPTNASCRLAPSFANVLGVFGTDGQPLPTRWPEENAGVIPQIAELRRQSRKSRAPKA